MKNSYYKNWAAYRKGFLLARNLNSVALLWPKHERYLLCDQVRRSSRSVCSNLAEGYGKRQYPKHFVSKLTDAISENYETQTWLDFALDLGYIDKVKYQELTKQSYEVGKLLTYMQQNPDRY